MKKIFLIIVGTAVLLVAWWLIEPLFGDDVVNEQVVVDIANRPNENLDNTEKFESSDQKIAQQDNSTQQTQPAPSPTTSQPTLYQGSFVDADRLHAASGQVYISGNDLSLVNLDSTNVPDARVYIARGTNAQDFIDIGPLKGNKGNQNYKIPDNLDVSEYSHVLIWCRAFSVLVGSARI